MGIKLDDRDGTDNTTTTTRSESGRVDRTGASAANLLRVSLRSQHRSTSSADFIDLSSRISLWLSCVLLFNWLHKGGHDTSIHRTA